MMSAYSLKLSYGPVTVASALRAANEDVTDDETCPIQSI
jgi:hypothetical protein